MNNTAAPIALGIIYGLIFLVFMVWMTKGIWMSLGHLTDKRALLQSDTAKDKLNQLLLNGDISIYSSMWSGEARNYRISVTYKGEGKDESISNSFRGEVFDKVIEEAYQWSVDRGYIKPEIVSPVPEPAPEPSAQ